MSSSVNTCQAVSADQKVGESEYGTSCQEGSVTPRTVLVILFEQMHSRVSNHIGVSVNMTRGFIASQNKHPHRSGTALELSSLLLFFE